MIKVDGLEKRFGSVAAVNDVTFTASDGAVTGLLGANGAGKSTILRMIGSLLKPNSGSVYVDGLDADAGSAVNRFKLGALLDHAGIYPRLTARENLLYFGRLRQMPPAALHRDVDRILSILDLETIADRRTGGFSQGERMKVALGRALLHGPRTLVLDEPTNGLDIPSARSLRSLLKTLRDSGLCILLSSHVLEDVRGICDKLVIIAQGRVVAEGSLESVCLQAGTDSLEDAFIIMTQSSRSENVLPGFHHRS